MFCEMSPYFLLFALQSDILIYAPALAFVLITLIYRYVRVMMRVNLQQFPDSSFLGYQSYV